MSTEAVDPRFVDLDVWPSVAAVEAMLEGQLAAIASLKSQTAQIAAAGEAAALRLKTGGRLFYVGAGTSGRVAVQDGVELSPTFNWPRERLVFLMAGGTAALTESAEGAEDDAVAGAAAVRDAGASESDVVIGVAASGRTPFTVTAIEVGRAAGALTIGIANNPGTPLLLTADHALLADTGSEVLAGSTRMKAGTAQKATLNLLSTLIMLRCGLVYRGLMVDMRVSNEKLLKRARMMVGDLAGVHDTIAADALDAAGRDIKQAVLVALGYSPGEAAAVLRSNAGNLRDALSEVRDGVQPNA